MALAAPHQRFSSIFDHFFDHEWMHYEFSLCGCWSQPTYPQLQVKWTAKPLGRRLSSSIASSDTSTLVRCPGQ